MYTLSITNPTQVLSVWTQIDALLRQSYPGNPNGHIACASKGGWCYDTVNDQLYLCTASDGSGNPAFTTWSLENFSLSYATTSSPGLVQLASSFNSSDAVLALTGASIGGLFARLGVNADITQLTGLTTPLSENQGGTAQHTFLAALYANLPSQSGQAGKVFGTNGSTIVLQLPGGYSGGVIKPTVGTQLSPMQLVILTTDGIQHTLPASPANGYWVAISPRNVSDVTFVTSDSSSIEESSNPFQVDRTYASPFRLVYSSTTNSWYYGA